MISVLHDIGTDTDTNIYIDAPLITLKFNKFTNFFYYTHENNPSRNICRTITNETCDLSN